MTKSPHAQAFNRHTSYSGREERDLAVGGKELRPEAVPRVSRTSHPTARPPRQLRVSNSTLLSAQQWDGTRASHGRRREGEGKVPKGSKRLQKGCRPAILQFSQHSGRYLNISSLHDLRQDVDELRLAVAEGHAEVLLELALHHLERQGGGHVVGPADQLFHLRNNPDWLPFVNRRGGSKKDKHTDAVDIKVSRK